MAAMHWGALTDDATVMSEILPDTDPVWGRGTALISARDDPAEITTAINTSSAQQAFGTGAVINDFDGILVMAPTMRHFALGASEYPVIAIFFGGLLQCIVPHVSSPAGSNFKPAGVE
jgi:hypothetical protein